ncbi:MAG: mechanosensitive ion channel family protein [Bradymonadia bacterium]
MMWLKQWLVTQLGEGLGLLIFYASALVLAVIVSVLAYRLAKRYVVTGVNYLIRLTPTGWDDILIDNKVFNRLALIVPAMVMFTFAPVFDGAEAWFARISEAYMILVGVMVVSAIINGYLEVYEKTEMSRERPMKSYVQVVVIFLYLIAGVFILSSLMGQSPWGILSGIGALTAVIMLIFKDSILGLVASIQLVAHDMLRKGDWIEMAHYGADGDVLDVTLNTVKIQNWDKTITTIPTYKLISDSFRNWRGMTESGGRRIKRSFNLDMGSIHLCDDALLDRLSHFPSIAEQVQGARTEIEAHKSQHGADGAFDTTRPTNLGLFRAYLEGYLHANPKIHKEMTFIVRHLAPTERGLPLEIYVFSNDQVWANYEMLQAEIIEHVLAVLPEFGLRMFQQPTGSDFRELADRVKG